MLSGVINNHPIYLTFLATATTFEVNGFNQTFLESYIIDNEELVRII